VNLREAQAVIEALLFVSNKPVTKEEIMKITNLSDKEVNFFLQNLANQCQAEERGIKLVKIAGGYQLGTKEQYAHYIEDFISQPAKTSLSSAALETLAIILYKQPITRAEIEEIRGVRVEKSLQTLLEKGLIEEVGRKNVIGKPILYGTTKDFLKYFGLFSLDELVSKLD